MRKRKERKVSPPFHSLLLSTLLVGERKRERERERKRGSSLSLFLLSLKDIEKKKIVKGDKTYFNESGRENQQDRQRYQIETRDQREERVELKAKKKKQKTFIENLSFSVSLLPISIDRSMGDRRCL